MLGTGRAAPPYHEEHRVIPSNADALLILLRGLLAEQANDGQITFQREANREAANA